MTLPAFSPAGVRLLLAALVLLLAALLWLSRPAPAIESTRADRLAAHLFTSYARESGEPPRHFSGPHKVDYADGWDYRWVYQPCAETGELRIFIARNGAARYTRTPDCAPARGPSRPLQRIVARV